jgi:hypothetical protein
VTAGVIWLKGLPLSQFDQAKDLRVLMHDWTSSLNGAWLDLVSSDDGLLVSTTNLAAVKTTEVAANVANREAIAFTIDIANVEQLKLDPKARVRRSKVVIVRSGVMYHGPGGHPYPLLLVAALSDQPEYFDKHIADFDRFLGQIVIDGKRGYQEFPTQRKDESPTPVGVNPPASAPSIPNTMPVMEAPPPPREDAAP